MRVLVVSPVVPYDNIGHAGGKTLNYYLKALSKEENIDVSALLFGKKEDYKKCDLNKYNISYETILTSGTLLSDIQHLVSRVFDFRRRKNPMFSSYKLQYLLKYLKKLNKCSKLPDLIEFEWTEMSLFAPYIKKKYPKIIIICSEHDVSYQGFYRKYIVKHDLRSYKTFKYLKTQEIYALQNSDFVLVQSEKDKKILESDGIVCKKIIVIAPYFHNMEYVKRENIITHDILFWGAMYRPENYEAAIWFINNVMTLIKDIDVRFIVAGNNPPKELKEYQNNRIIVTGFVKDETELFKNSMCFVSPLQTGAGIKVKVLEALSSGIPVLTNQIGIEGIPAKNNISYFHCEKPQEYENTIRRLYNNEIDLKSLKEEQLKFINEEFNVGLSVKEYIKKIKLVGNVKL